MKVAQTIDVQSWMTSGETRQLWRALNDDGARQTLFVGGAVRNALLGATVDDLDLATIHTPDEVIRRLEDAHIRAIPTGLDHGTVTAVVNKKSFEITTLRKDVETDGRHAIVEFSTDWGEDAARRDFTMNTLLADIEGNVFDPTGRGIDDLNSRALCFVGDAAARIAEDYLRILRYFRFHALYGGGDMDAEILAACKHAAPHVASLSRERITQEFFKIIMVSGAGHILKVMRENNILTDLLTIDSGALETLAHLIGFQEQYNLEQLSSRFFMLAGEDLKNTMSFDSHLVVPKVIMKDMKALQGARGYGDLSSEQALKKAIYKYGKTATAQALMIALARDEINNADASDALRIIKIWDVPTFPVTGNDLIAEGFKAGRELGKELSRREQVWINNGFKS